MKTLKLFNAVISKPSNIVDPTITENGFIIMPNALWAKDRITEYLEKEKLNGNDLNKTFHKSWQKIKDSSRFELLIHQILHYLSTYGSNFEDEVYIPNEVLELPDVKLKFKVIRAYTKDEMKNKCLDLLKSGIALKEETINDLIEILVDKLDYSFTGKEGIKNKEAIVKIADNYNVYPNSNVEFFRYIIYKTTGQTLLIKNDDMIENIKVSNFNPTIHFKRFGLKKLAEIFNRFKPLFLAYKTKCPKTINKISKLSKKYHKPLIMNPLNELSSTLLTNNDIHWLNNATIFSLFKALSYCFLIMQGPDAFVYRIRNGKSFVDEKNVKNKSNIFSNFQFIFKYLSDKYDFSDKKFYFPKDIYFALPTSEKMFVGNIPTGTKFCGEKLAVGIYWKNSWGARDLDLSGVNIGGKVGWNSVYKQGRGSLMFSGDITDAPNGAVEYLYANKDLNNPTLIQNNVYCGNINSKYKIIIGKGDDISQNYMMNPNNLFTEISTQGVQEQMILGLFLPENESGSKQSFVILNFGSGQTRVSGWSEISKIATRALYQQWKNPLSFNLLIDLLKGKFVDKPEKANYNFSLDNLEKDSFTNIFKL
jgi:hypothetical protein